MAEAKSKGRGEECISQNLRILRGHNGKRVMLFFANSQRGALKRYVSIPREFYLYSFFIPFPTFHTFCVETPGKTHDRSPCNFKTQILLPEYLSKTSHSQLRGERETTQESRATGTHRAQSEL